MPKRKRLRTVDFLAISQRETTFVNGVITAHRVTFRTKRVYTWGVNYYNSFFLRADSDLEGTTETYLMRLPPLQCIHFPLP